MIRYAVAALLALASASACADIRCCTTPVRNADGTIHRSAATLRAFTVAYPKPAGEWVRDHVIPLACGGSDTVENLQWLPVAAWRDKSKWERKVYGGRGMSAGCP